MTEYHWPSVRDQLIEMFNGELPRPETEQDIIESFRERPRSVLVVAAEIAKSKNAPRSYWAVLRKRLGEVNTAPDVTATDTTERERKIVDARRWIHNAGVHFDREDDIVDELFGSQGMLAGFDSEQLRSEMIEAWRQERPRGETAEREAEEWQRQAGVWQRQRRWTEARARKERWAMVDQSAEAYEQAFQAGQRPHWKPGQTPTWQRQQAEPKPF